MILAIRAKHQHFRPSFRNPTRLPFTAAASSTRPSLVHPCLSPDGSRVTSKHHIRKEELQGDAAHRERSKVKFSSLFQFQSTLTSVILHTNECNWTFLSYEPCKEETNREDHAHWRFNQNQIGKGKLLHLDQSLSCCKSRLLCCLWQGCVSFPQPRISSRSTFIRVV